MFELFHAIADSGSAKVRQYVTDHDLAPRLLVLAGCGGVFAAAFFGWLPLYLPELFPTRIRATGEGLTFNAGRVMSAVGVLGMGQMVSLLGGYRQAGVAMSCIWLVGLALIGFAPETRGCELPE